MVRVHWLVASLFFIFIRSASGEEGRAADCSAQYSMLGPSRLLKHFPYPAFVRRAERGLSNEKFLNRVISSQSTPPPNLNFIKKENLKIVYPEKLRTHSRKISYLSKTEVKFSPLPNTKASELFPHLLQTDYELGKALTDQHGLQWRVVGRRTKNGGEEAWADGKRKFIRMIDESEKNLGFHLESISGQPQKNFISLDEFIRSETEFPMTMAKLEIKLRSGKKIIRPIAISLHGLESFRKKESSQFLEALTHLPEETIGATSEFVLPYRKSNIMRGGIFAAGYADKSRRNTIFFYSGGVESKDFAKTLVHEHGHNIAMYVWKKHIPPSAWEEAMKQDNSFVSSYAKTSSVEDFAETVEAYLLAKGGLEDPDPRIKFSARFAFLDQIFNPEKQGLDGEFWKAIATYYQLQNLTISGEAALLVPGIGFPMLATAGGLIALTQLQDTE